MNSKKRILDYSAFTAPKYWGTWVGLFFLWLIAFIPQKLRIILGTAIGNLAYTLLAKRRRIAETNIRLCFPELSPEAQKQLVRKSFHSNGIGFFEASAAWFRNPESYRSRVTIHGLEHVEKALEKGRGVIALGGHFTTLDLGAALATLSVTASAMQRDHDNPLFNAVMTRRRYRFFEQLLDKNDLRGLIRALRENKIIWYATDQDYGRRGAVFAPFFGVPAATITATSRIVKKTGAVVLPFSHFRADDNKHYHVYFGPALENYPTGDDTLDAATTNKVIEEAIRTHPDQYLWMHRRFKTEPDGDNHQKYK